MKKPDTGEEELEGEATTEVIVMNGKMPIRWTSTSLDYQAQNQSTFLLGKRAQDAMWPTKVMRFMGVMEIPRVEADNKGALILAYNTDHHKWTKHIRRRLVLLDADIISFGNGDLIGCQEEIY